MNRQRGFTLVELIIVMVLIGIIAGILALQIRPAMQSYLAIRQRANLTSQADAALRRILWEVRTAVPNSLRYTLDSAQSGTQNQCIEFVPTRDGGRFRMAPDYHDPANPGGTALERDTPTTTFNTLTKHDPSLAGDYLFIGNYNGNDVYDVANSWQIKTVAPAAMAADGQNLITLATAASIPAGYDGGRFVVIPAKERSVTYTCTKPGTDASGTGTAFIYRVTTTTPSTTPATTCPTGGAVLVAKVSDCGILYRENQGVTQQSGYMQLRLGLSDGGETVKLTMGAHVENTP